MRIVALHSHASGQEYILVHKPDVWTEIEELIAAVDASVCRAKASKDKPKQGKTSYSSVRLGALFDAELRARNWHESRISHWVARDSAVVNRIIEFPAEQQREEIVKTGLQPIPSHNQTNFVKERVALGVQFGKYPFVAYDLFVKHMAFFVGDQIDVGVEILAMKELQAECHPASAITRANYTTSCVKGEGFQPCPWS